MKMETINVEYANNLISNTLLNSIKTGQPLIDALNSLIFLSGNKNKYLKSIIIVIILSFGILVSLIFSVRYFLTSSFEAVRSFIKKSRSRVSLCRST